MAGIELKHRAFDAIRNTNIDFKNEIIEKLAHHIDMLDKKIEQLEGKNNRLERKYWEIKIKYEKE